MAPRRSGAVPRPIRGIEIYLPLDYNDGRPIEDSKFIDVLITVQELLAV